MMLRRHNIAHKFDYIQENGQKRLNDIEFRAVVEWTNNLMDFLQGLLKDVFLSDQLAIDIQGKAKTLGVIATKEEVQETIKGFIHIDRFDIPWSKTK